MKRENSRHLIPTKGGVGEVESVFSRDKLQHRLSKVVSLGTSTYGYHSIHSAEVYNCACTYVYVYTHVYNVIRKIKEETMGWSRGDVGGKKGQG